MQEIFARVGKKYGYDDVKADFTPFKDFKVKWMRSYKWINFDVSDYLLGAPTEVLESIAETLFKKIRNEDGAEYSKEVCDWLTSAEFIEKNQQIYMRRCRGMSFTSKGKKHDLAESYDRLVGLGLVERDADIEFRWVFMGTQRQVGHSSVLMKVVAVNDRLDDAGITEELLDYAVYTQVAHVGLGFNATGRNRAGEYNAKLNAYPDRVRLEAELMDLGFTI